MLTWRVFAEPVTKMHTCILAIVIHKLCIVMCMVPFKMFSLVERSTTVDAGGEGTGEIVLSFDGIMISDKLSDIDELEVSSSGSSLT